MHKIKLELDQIIEDPKKTEAVIDHLIDAGLVTTELLHLYNTHDISKEVVESPDDDILGTDAGDYL